MENLALRKKIDELIAAGKAEVAASYLASFWYQEGGPATAAYAVSRYEALKQRLKLTPFRLAILRSFTLEPVVPLLRADAFAAGVDLVVHMGDFNTYVQEIVNKDSSLYRFAPDAVILGVQACDIAPHLWKDCADFTTADFDKAVTRVVASFREWVDIFRKHSRSQLIIHNLEQVAIPYCGVLDSQSDNGQAASVARINRELQRMAKEFDGVYILDYDALVARHGRLSWRDERKWMTVRMPISARHLLHVAQEWVRFLQPLAGRIAKALVVDLDNTLWGGVLGEDGMAGIQVGTEYPGAAYQALQRAILDLYRRGILIAVCSKNDLREAIDALKHHPGMLLRPEHFAALRINWEEKPKNLEEIAAELNIGIDSLVFLDDNPVERQRVRSELPEVTVIELPKDPLLYAETLRNCSRFERLTLSEEDHRRNEYYAKQRLRIEFAQSQGSSKEEYYRSLRQEVEIAPVEPLTVPRVAQLTQKTNQFNCTTRRYTEQQIKEMAASPNYLVCAMRVEDCFGDNGLVGVAIAHQVGTIFTIDTFLLSCRVIGRTVETALLSYVVAQAQEQGAQLVQGWFLPTKKNTPAKNFYRDHGFHLVTETDEGALWEWALSQGEVSCPDWIRLIVAERERK